MFGYRAPSISLNETSLITNVSVTLLKAYQFQNAIVLSSTIFTMNFIYLPCSLTLKSEIAWIHFHVIWFSVKNIAFSYANTFQPKYKKKYMSCTLKYFRYIHVLTVCYVGTYLSILKQIISSLDVYYVFLQMQ